MVEHDWLEELGACQEACIVLAGVLDPNEFWRETSRVDWMLYVLGFIQRRGDDESPNHTMLEFSTSEFGEDWNGRGGCWGPPWEDSTYAPEPKDAARADRLREIWPDLPILGV